MPYIEERVEHLEETVDKLLKLSEQILQIIKESEKIREQERKEWNEKFEKERIEREKQRREDWQDWSKKLEEERRKDWEEWNKKLEEERRQREEQRKRDWEEWNRKLEEERKQREEEHKQWLERFEKEKQEREEQRKKDWEEWSRKLEEERRKSWEEWERKFEQQKREDRKKWEEMVLRLGTLVEDIVAPNIPNIAKKYFGCVDIEFDGLRIKKRHSQEKGKIKEFDYILVCDDIIVVNETKANPKPEYAKEFVEFIRSGEFWEYFPEYRDKKFIPVFSTLYMPEDIIKYLTKNKIYALAMKGDEMDILNYKEINGG